MRGRGGDCLCMTEGEGMERRKLKSGRNSGEARALPVLTLAFNLGF